MNTALPRSFRTTAWACFASILSLLSIGKSARAGNLWISPEANFSCNLQTQQILDAPNWSPELPLPLSLGDAVVAARQRLGTVTKDVKDWFVYDITLLNNIPNAPLKWSYEITLCRLAGKLGQSDTCKLNGRASLGVAMNGQVGALSKLAPPFPWWRPDGACASLPYQQAWQSHSAKKEISFTSLPRADLLGGPDWTPFGPLPLDLAQASKIGLNEAGRLVPSPSEWRIYSFGLQVLPGTAKKWFYHFYIVHPSKTTSIGNTGEMVVQVTLDGKVGLPKRMVAH